MQISVFKLALDVDFDFASSFTIPAGYVSEQALTLSAAEGRNREGSIALIIAFGTTEYPIKFFSDAGGEIYFITAEEDLVLNFIDEGSSETYDFENLIDVPGTTFSVNENHLWGGIGLALGYIIGS